MEAVTDPMLVTVSKMAILRKTGEEANMGCHVLISVGCLSKFRLSFTSAHGKDDACFVEKRMKTWKSLTGSFFGQLWQKLFT